MVQLFYKPELTFDDIHDIRVALGLIANHYRKLIAEAGVISDSHKYLEESAARYDACANKLRGLNPDRIEEVAL